MKRRDSKQEEHSVSRDSATRTIKQIERRSRSRRKPASQSPLKYERRMNLEQIARVIGKKEWTIIGTSDKTT